ncbi:MAG: hypothetical protein ACI915_002883 [Gammaproteobacteria bacterium]|jgi:hypothetical protein
MTPRFAVVGHPNKGKSSIVATLAEDTQVAISDTPGTTLTARAFPLRVDGEVLYELIDTPGFQRPREVLAWLQRESSGAQDRAATVARFVDVHRADERFTDECELLRPLVEGAGILYVVDGSRPYGPEYETEMEILRWTGRPRMALINMIGAHNHIEAWQRALDQYFSIVRIFDAQHADLAKRLALLRSFGELHPPWRPGIDRAITALAAEYRQREAAVAAAISELLVTALTAEESASTAEGADPHTLVAKLEHRLREKLRLREQACRTQIELMYRHNTLQRSESAMPVIDHDLFSSESAQMFGLSRIQLAATGAMSGAIAGGGIDVMLGGASLLAGAGIGAVVGGVSALFGSERLGRIKVLGQSLMSHKLTVGPFRDPNLPWTLLGRALLHYELVSERNHARRDAVAIEAESGSYRAEQIAETDRKTLNAAFQTIRRSGYDPRVSVLVMTIEHVLLGHTHSSTPATRKPSEPDDDTTRDGNGG